MKKRFCTNSVFYPRQTRNCDSWERFGESIYLTKKKKTKSNSTGKIVTSFCLFFISITLISIKNYRVKRGLFFWRNKRNNNNDNNHNTLQEFEELKTFRPAKWLPLELEKKRRITMRGKRERDRKKVKFVRNNFSQFFYALVVRRR